MYMIIDLQDVLSWWDLQNRSLSDAVIAKHHPIPFGPTPPPSPPPTPPQTPPRSSSGFHPIYTSFIEGKDFTNSFDQLIDEYEKLIYEQFTEKYESRMKRSSTNQPDSSTYVWHCVKKVNDEDTSTHLFMGDKFLTWGGRIVDQAIDSESKPL